jgi:hypothetical protein
VNGVTWAGALLVLASAIIHLRLWAGAGYQGIAIPAQVPAGRFGRGGKSREKIRQSIGAARP